MITFLERFESNFCLYNHQIITLRDLKVKNMTKTKGSNLFKRSPTHSTNTRTLGLYRARGGDENLVAVFERRADDPKSSTGIFEGSELKERGRLGRIRPRRVW